MPGTAATFLVGALAISALPPLNGFVSEFIVYSGLLSGSAPSAFENVALVATAAILAFVGAVSAFSMTRAFGLAFLGSPRHTLSSTLPTPSGWMMTPMALHALGAIAVGLLPELGLRLVRSTVALFSVHADLDVALKPLAPMVWASRVLAVCLLSLGLTRWLQGRRARLSVTWGCGYTAPTARMQYTGSSFTEHFARIFDSFLPAQRREQLPTETFPQRPGLIATHHADPVEQRMYEVLGQGEELAARTSEKISEQPRFAFAAGLVTLLLLGALVFGAAQSW